MKTPVWNWGFSLVFCAVLVGQSSAGQAAPSAQTAAQTTQGKSSFASQSESARQEQIRRLAEELAALTKSIPADIDAANKGLLPKDMAQKLNRIEKLSKQLRKELAAQ